MQVRVAMEYVCHDYKLRDRAELLLDENVANRMSPNEILKAMKPIILQQHPDIADAIDFVESLKITIERT